ncbi:MAG: hypothetical protein ACI9CF_000661 [Candidatus Omnitrophota bacterium]|jgi:hypothetical protein
MGVIDSIKKGFSIAKGSSQLIILIFAFGFVWSLINIPFQGAAPDSPTIPMIVLGIVFILTSIFMQAGTLGYILEAIKSGSSSLATFKGTGRSAFMRLLGIGAVVALIMLILTIVIILIATLGGDQVGPIVAILGAALAVVGGVSIFSLFLAPYAVIVDDAGVLPAIKRSIAVVKGNALPLIGMIVMLVLIGFAIGFLMGFILGLLASVISGTAEQVMNGFFTSAVKAYLSVVASGAFMSYYLSLGQSTSSDSVSTT